MHLNLTPDEIRPLVRDVIVEVIAKWPPELRDTCAPIVTHEKAAEMLGLSAYSLHEYRKAGKIAGARVGKSYCYRRDELLRFVAENETHQNN